MIVYSIMLILSLILCYFSLNSKNKKLKITYAILSALPFIIVAGIRYDVGTDYMYRYVPDYLNILNGVKVENIEVLFYLLIRICMFITHDYWLLFFASAAITFSLIYKTIYEESKNKLLSILLLFITSMFFVSLNLMRQYISIAILYSTYKYLIKGETIKWIISVIIASLFHTSSLVFLLAYFLRKKKINDYIFLTILIILLIFGKELVSLLLSLFNKINIANLNKYSAYINYGGNFSWSHFLVESIVLLYYLVIIKIKKMKLNTLELFYLNCQYLVLLFSVLNTFVELFLRISFMFTIIQLSAIPYFYEKSKKLKTEVKKDIIIYKPCIMLSVVLVLFSVRLIYSNIIKNAADVFPYKTIFNRDLKEK